MLPFFDASEHLTAELRLLELKLERQVLRLRVANLFNQDQFRGLFISDAQIDALLSRNCVRLMEGSADRDHQESTVALTERIEHLQSENRERVAASLDAQIPLPFSRLADLFGLSPLEIDALLVAAAPDIDLNYETLYAYVQNDVTKKRPRVDLLMRLLCSTLSDRISLRACLAPDAPLLRNQLIRLVGDPQDLDPPLLGRFIKADERIVDFIIGLDRLDGRLVPYARLHQPSLVLADLTLPKALSAQLHSAGQFASRRGGIFLFHGPYGAGKETAAAALCSELGRPLLVADVAQALAAGSELPASFSLLRREATLRGAALLLSHYEALLTNESSARSGDGLLRLALPPQELPLFIASEQPWQLRGKWLDRFFLAFEFPRPDFHSRLQLWRQALASNGNRLSEEIDLNGLAGKFQLTGGEIADAAHKAMSLALLRDPAEQVITDDDLHVAARGQSNQDLHRLAQKVETPYGWSDIVLPPRALGQLKDVHSSARYRHVIYSDWGFDRKLALGKGLNALFCGPSGTGKTMAASILAHEMGLDLYKIDLSSVISKYIGETEKHLSRIFEEAQTSNAILFFDEADALFGKRSEVKDAHDRYANIEVAYLLQKMEEYDGIVILATNLRNNIDDAFGRRMHHIVEFPFPDVQYRERIWRAVMPSEAPLADGVDFAFLARQFEITGGNIRNVVLAAAFKAAENATPIGMGHLVLAVSRELQKIGKLPSRANFREYYELIREGS